MRRTVHIRRIVALPDLRSGLNTRSTFRFRAFMTPIRAIIVGPLRDTSIRTSIAVCHSGRSDSFFGRLVM